MVTSSTYQWVVETGYVKGVRRTLLRWIEARLGEVPTDVLRALEACEDPAALDRATEAMTRTIDEVEALPGAVLAALRPTPTEP